MRKIKEAWMEVSFPQIRASNFIFYLMMEIQYTNVRVTLWTTKGPADGTRNTLMREGWAGPGWAGNLGGDLSLLA